MKGEGDRDSQGHLPVPSVGTLLLGDNEQLERRRGEQQQTATRISTPAAAAAAAAGVFIPVRRGDRKRDVPGAGASRLLSPYLLLVPLCTL